MPPQRRDAQANRAKLLDAARQVFAERGLDVTLDDIAVRAQVGVGTAYRNFANKDALIDELLFQRMDELTAMARHCLAIEDPWTALRTFLEQIVELQCQDRGLKQVLYSPQRAHKRVAKARDQLVPVIAELVDRAKAAGQVRPDASSTDVAVINIMVGTVLDLARGIDPHVHLRYLEILLAGLRADGAVPGTLPAGPMERPALERAMRRWPTR